MKTLKITLIIVFSLSLFVSTGYSEWQKGERIYLGNKINSRMNYGFTFDKTNRKILLSSESTSFKDIDAQIYDIETLVPVGEIDVNYPSSSNILYFDNINRRLYTTGADISGSNKILAIDPDTNKLLGVYTCPYSLNYNVFTFDPYKNKMYLNVNGAGLNGEKSYIFIIDGKSFTEEGRIEIPSKKRTSRYAELYKTMFFDNETNLLYIAFENQETGSIDENTYYKTHKDSLYVIDLAENKLIKSMPVGAGPSDIQKNDNNGEIYVYSNGSYITDPVNYGFFSRNFIVTVIDNIKSEVVEELELAKNGDAIKFTISEKNNLLYFAGNIVSGVTNKTIGTFNDSKGNISSFYDELSDKLYSLSRYDMTVFDGLTGAKINKISTGITLNNIDILPLKNELYYFYEDQLGIISLSENNTIQKIKTNIFSSSLKINKYNGFAYMYDNSGLYVYDLENDILLKSKQFTFDFDGNRSALRIDEDLQLIYIMTSTIGSYKSFLYVFDLNNLELIKKIDLDLYQPEQMEIDEINHKIYIADQDLYGDLGQVGSNIDIIDGLTNTVILKRKIGQLSQWYGKMALYPQKEWLLTRNMDNNTISVYNSQTLDEIRKINLSKYPFNFNTDILINYLTEELFLQYNDKLVIVDLKTDLIKKIIINEPFTSLDTNVFNPISNKVYFTDTMTASIQVYENPDYPGYIGPEPPSDLSSTSETKIELSWTQASNPDVRGYNIYRAPPRQNQWTKLHSKFIAGTVFTDETALPNTPYDYRISSIGLYNIEGKPSEPITALYSKLPDFVLTPVQSSLSTSQETTVDYIITSESVEKFGSKIELFTDLVPSGTKAIISANQIAPGDILTLSITISDKCEPGKYSFNIVGKSGDIEHRIPLSLTVVRMVQEESNITASLNEENIEFGTAIFISGRIIPPTSTEVSLLFTHGNKTLLVKTTSNNQGMFSADFAPDIEGHWKLKASWSGNSSFSGSETNEKDFDVLSGKSKITCTTDAPAEAKIGWQMTIKGMVFPNPGIGDVKLYVTKPDSTKQVYEGLKINELGYYGYNITADQKGLWSITAVWAGNNKYSGASSENLVIPFGMDIGRAIIVVCPPKVKAYYETANNLGKVVFDTFNNRRFDNPRIKYLDENTNQDLNGDGFNNDVDGIPTPENIENSLTGWAAEAVNDSTPMYLYIIGEDSKDGVELPDGKQMAASHLKELMDTMQTKSNCKNITTIIDASNAETFLNQLKGPGRCVITSTKQGESASVAEGKLSFTQYFCNYANQGKSVTDAFINTKNIISELPGKFKSQEPQIETNGNNSSNQKEDLEKASNLFIGSSYGLQKTMPELKYMSAASIIEKDLVGKSIINTRGVLSGSPAPQLTVSKASAMNGVNIWVQTDDFEKNISNVYATVFSPSDEIIQEIELTDTDRNGRYDGVVNGINILGAYKVITYAYDENRNVSEPMKALIAVIENNEDTDIEANNQPLSFKVYNPYPNPFNPYTTIRYELPEKTNFELVIYDVLGRKVRILEKGNKSPGTYESIWDGRTDEGFITSSGVYFYILKAGKYLTKGKMALIK